jgi:hypothetical protein
VTPLRWVLLVRTKTTTGVFSGGRSSTSFGVDATHQCTSVGIYILAQLLPDPGSLHNPTPRHPSNLSVRCHNPVGRSICLSCRFIVKGLTQKFKDQDLNLTGKATSDYTAFMLMVIPCVAA